MIQIKHARPKHDYFTICLPKANIPYGDRVNFHNKPNWEPVIYELEDPNDPEAKIKCELVDLWGDFNLNELPDDTLNAFSLATYGLPIKKLKHVLLRKYEILNVNPRIEFLLLKQL